jgi:ParB/RepB/Spo0J family partition protein
MNQPTIQQVPADKIVAGLNDRETFNRAELEALAANIAEYGLLQPPVYRPLADGTFQIVAGERRTRAMRDVLGWPLIPCIVNAGLADDADAVGAMGSENRCRVNLAVMEDAKSYQAAMARFGWAVEECARRYGVSTRTVKDRLALLALCDEAQDLVNKGTLTPGYALALALAGLDRNMQNRALDLLKANRSPNLDWWRGAVAELVLVAGQNSMFDLDAFMSGAVARGLVGRSGCPVYRTGQKA